MLKYMQFATLMLVGLIVGCGGGASLTPEGSGEGEVTVEVKFFLYDCSDADTTVSPLVCVSSTQLEADSNDNYLVVQVEVNGQLLNDPLIELSSDVGSMFLVEGGSIEGIDGTLATFRELPDSGSVTVTVTYSEQEYTQTYTIREPLDTVSAGIFSCPSFDLASPSLDDCSPTLDVYSDPTTVVVGRALTDGLPVANHLISVAANLGDLSSTTTLTDSEGYGYWLLGPAQSQEVVTVTTSFKEATSTEVYAKMHGEVVSSSQQVAVSVWDQDCPPSDVACSPIQNVSSAETAIILVEATDSLLAADNQLVSVTASKGSLSPGDGIALTNADGQAQLEYSAGTNGGVVSFSATYEGATSSYNATIDLVELEVALSSPLAADEEISKNSTLAVTATLTVDGGADRYETPVDVTFSSNCLSTETAQLSETVTAVDGIATAVYKPLEGCVQEDTIKAEVILGGQVSSSTLTVDIAETEVDNIVFVSAEPQLISIRGSGEDTTSQLTFQVKDKEGDAKAGELVLFEKASGQHDLEFFPASATSDSQGFVTVTVKPDRLPGVFRVRATVDDATPTITAVSGSLTVSGGLPDSDSFNIALDISNPDAWGWVNESVTATAVVADHFNNPVPDGTTVYFTVEHGRIEPRPSCETVNSTCSVQWFSHGESDFGPQPRDARVSVMAYVEGEESYWDNDGDNQYTFGVDNFITSLHDMGEAYRDDDEDYVYDATGTTEQLIDRNNDDVYTAGDGILNGQSCSEASEIAGDCNIDLVDIMSRHVIVLSGGNSQISYCSLTGDCSVGMPGGAGEPSELDTDVLYTCAFDVAPDGSINPVPFGSTISFSVGGGDVKLVGATAFEQSSTNVAIYHTSIGLGNVGVDDRVSCPGGFYAVGVDRSDGGGTIVVTLDTPKSIAISNSITVLP